MKTRWITIALLAAGLIAWVAGVGFTDEKEPTEEEMMMKMMELGKPSAHHDNLKPFAGIWDVKSTFYMESGENVSDATATIEPIFGGRFLIMKYSGAWGPMPFTGKAVVGHNNVTKKYQYGWFDNFGSGVHFMEGTCSEDGKTITFTGKHASPWGDYGARWVMTSESAEKFTFTMYSKKGDEEEKKEGHLVFTKPKKLNEMEMWPKMMELGQPAAHHGHMKPLAGDFSIKGKMFSAMGEMPFEGDVSTTWVMGNRFLRTKYTGAFMGSPFEGFGLMGYDNVRQKYQNTWAMTIATGMDWSFGSYDAETKTFTFEYEMQMPDRSVYEKRETIVVKSDDEYVSTSYSRLKGAKEEHKEMEMVATRKKAETTEESDEGNK